MPFKSKAQMKRMVELIKTGEITQTQFDEHLSKTDLKSLPEKVPTKPLKGLVRTPRRTR